MSNSRRRFTDLDLDELLSVRWEPMEDNGSTPVDTQVAGVQYRRGLETRVAGHVLHVDDVAAATRRSIEVDAVAWVLHDAGAPWLSPRRH